MPVSINIQNRDRTIRMAQEKFNRVLRTVFNELAFMLMEDEPDILQGARVTAVLFLSRFVDMFGDLVEKEDYNIESFKRRNREAGFGIDESVFEEWKNAGCFEVR